MRLRRLLRWWPVAVVLFLVALIVAAWPGRWTFTVSPETTYVTEPLDENGFVDYPTALNQRLGKGITPETNANVLLWQALGPKPEGAPMPDGYFKWLGIDPPPEAGEYFVSDADYFKAQVAKAPGQAVGFSSEQDERKQWDERVSQARKRSWKASDEPDVAKWLKRNEKPLAIAIEASKRPDFFNPLVSKSSDPRTTRVMNSLLPNIQKCRAIGGALACRAMLRAGEGDLDGAWQDLLASQRLGRLICRNGSGIECLVGYALVAIATNTQVAALGHSSPTSKQLAKWQDDLRQLPPLPPIADTFDLPERFQTLDNLTSIVAAGAIPAGGPTRTQADELSFTERLFTHGIDWDPAFRAANKLFNECAAASRLPDQAARKAEFDRIDAQLNGEIQAARGGGIIGKIGSRADRGRDIGNILLHLLIEALTRIQNAHDRTLQNQANLEVAVALAAYRADSGRYPKQLQDLAPKYLTAIPGDMFSGQPLIYRPTAEGYLLYSVGINGVDDGGRSADDEPKGDDLVIRMVGEIRVEGWLPPASNK